MDAEFLTKLNWLNAVSAQCRTGGEDAPTPSSNLGWYPLWRMGHLPIPNQCEVPGCTKKLSDLSTCFDCEYLKSRRCPNWDDCHGLGALTLSEESPTPSCKECHQVELKRLWECPNHLQCGGDTEGRARRSSLNCSHGGRSETDLLMSVQPAIRRNQDENALMSYAMDIEGRSLTGSGLFDICPKCYKGRTLILAGAPLRLLVRIIAKNWKTGQLYEMCRDCYNYVE